MLPAEYKQYLKANLDWTGGLWQGTEVRLDYINLLLCRLIQMQGGTLPVTSPGAVTTVTVEAPSLAVNKESFITGQKDVTTAGTAVQLTTSSIPIPNGFQLTVIAKPGNTGYIYFGYTQSEAEGTTKFDGLAAGLAHSFRITNANLVWVNSSVDGEGVSWIVER